MWYWILAGIGLLVGLTALIGGAAAAKYCGLVGGLISMALGVALLLGTYWAYTHAIA